jgi:hypothetical protein
VLFGASANSQVGLVSATAGSTAIAALIGVSAQATAGSITARGGALVLLAGVQAQALVGAVSGPPVIGATLETIRLQSPVTYAVQITASAANAIRLTSRIAEAGFTIDSLLDFRLPASSQFIVLGLGIGGVYQVPTVLPNSLDFRLPINSQYAHRGLGTGVN